MLFWYVSSRNVVLQKNKVKVNQGLKLAYQFGKIKRYQNSWFLSYFTTVLTNDHLHDYKNVQLIMEQESLDPSSDSADLKCH